MVVRTQVTAQLIPTDPESLGQALNALEGVDELRAKLGEQRAWLVGGAVRDLLLGGTRADLDLVVEGDAAAAAALLGAETKAHERFRTASVDVGGVRVDVAAARRETYAHPGALPKVEPAALNDDLARRDFTVNAMALPLSGKADLVDPFAGKADLEARTLRVLHPGSFKDDPTRALRAARYAARLDLSLEPETAKLLEGANLTAVSEDRVNAELGRLLAEERAPEALELLARWGLAGIDDGASDRARAARERLADPSWAELVDEAEAMSEAARPGDGARRAVAVLTRKAPERPSAGMGLVAGFRPVELLMARISGAEWLDEWAREWRGVSLEIDGEDLMEAGLAQGPAVGRGLEAALAARLDGEIATRDEELRVALAAAAST
jgi:tRNA nucleotidyltransferase (CCA-adding enzyme)